VTTDGTPITVPLEFGAAGGPGEEVSTELVLGVRPEDIVLSPEKSDNSIRTSVFVVEKMGSKNIVDLKYGEEILRAKVSPTARLSLNQTVYATFDWERIRLFDKASTRSLARAATETSVRGGGEA
jgi:multiple sugar transport system ATP-binding protein